MAQEAMYEYTAITDLRTIRLIHLHPGAKDDPVRLSLETTPLDAAPAFEAISYCWGDSLDQREVTCNGAVLSITNSLFTGLVRFRHSHEPRVLWADAICINQADAAEKGHQVMLMADIYSQATRVLVWIGIADDLVHGSVPSSVLASVRQLMKLIPGFNPENTTEIAAKAAELYRHSQRLHNEGKPSLLDHDWVPLAMVLVRPWFRRKWVVQEVVLAKEAVLYVGDHVEVPWPEIALLAFRLECMGISRLVESNLDQWERKNEESRPGLEGHRQLEPGKSPSLCNRFLVSLHCITTISMIQMYRHAGTFLDTVVASKFFHCTDPKDYVYSLLSLGAIGPTIQPDYGASVAEVYRQFSIKMLLEGQSLKLISMAPDRFVFPDPKQPRLEGLPSWVPDLRLMRTDLLINYTIRPQAFFAGGQAKPTLSISKDQRILSCQGWIIDTVRTSFTCLIEMESDDRPGTQSSSDSIEGASTGQPRKLFAHWLERCYEIVFGHMWDPERLVNPNSELMLAFSRTILCGIDGIRNRLSPELLSEFPTYMKWVIDYAGNSDVEVSQHMETMPKFAMSFDHVVRSCSSLRLCITEKERFARIPIGSQSGDCICVLRGGEVPFVVRPTDHGTYTLIGECYVDGVMDGEALDEVVETIQLE